MKLFLQRISRSAWHSALCEQHHPYSSCRALDIVKTSTYNKDSRLIRYFNVRICIENIIYIYVYSIILKTHEYMHALAELSVVHAVVGVIEMSINVFLDVMAVH